MKKSHPVKARKGAMFNAFSLLTMLALLIIGLPAHSQTSAQTSARATTPAGSIVARDMEVQDGDTLSIIARRELGKSGLSWYLAEFNNLAHSTPLVAGQIIRIPIYVPLRLEFATVVFVKGDSLRNDAALQRNDEIYLDDLVVTGNSGFVSLQFSSGSVINLQPNTSARLVRLNCLPDDDSCLVEIQASRGQVTSDIETRDDQPLEFRIRTPYASAAVRGTVFDFDARESSLLIGVTEGEVAVSALNQEVTVPEGFGSITEEGQPPAPPVELLPAPVFRYIPARAATGDEVAWWALSAVNTYTAQLSTDSEGNSVVAEFTSEDDGLEIAGVESGDYYINLRGVDDNGLKGFETTARVTVADIDTSLPVVNTTIRKNGNDFLVAVIDPPVIAAGYEIQISDSEDFSDPLSADISSSGSAIFRLDSQTIFARARILQDPLTVSEFGSITESR